jgi:hypothetical protein
LGSFQIVVWVANLYKVHLKLKVPVEGWQPFNPLRQFEMNPTLFYSGTLRLFLFNDKAANTATGKKICK